MIPPGLAFISVSAKAWKQGETSDLPRYYFDLKKEKKNADKGESAYTPNTSLILALNAALKYIKTVGMDKLVANAQLLAAATRAAVTELGLELFCPALAGRVGDGRQGPGGHGFRRHREGIPHPLRRDHRQRPGHDEGPDLPHRAPGLLRFRRRVRHRRGAGDHPGRRRRSGEVRRGRGGGAEEFTPKRRGGGQDEDSDRGVDGPGRHRAAQGAARLGGGGLEPEGVRAAPGRLRRAVRAQRRQGDQGRAGAGAEAAA